MLNNKVNNKNFSVHIIQKQNLNFNTTTIKNSFYNDYNNPFFSCNNNNFNLNYNSISNTKKTRSNFNSNNSNHFLIKTQHKTFLRKYYKGYFQSLQMQIFQKDPEYVEVTEPIIFEAKKFTILDMDPAKPDRLSSNLLLASYAIIGFFAYKVAVAIYSFAYFRSFFWTIALFYALRFRLGILSNQEHIIREIHVFNDGKTCEITTITRSFTVDINKIRKISIEEALLMANKLESLKVNFIPIVVETSLYLIPIRSRIHRKDFLGSVCDGKYLKFEEVINKDNSIHV